LNLLFMHLIAESSTDITEVPRLVLIAGYVRQALRVAQEKAVLVSVRGQPLAFWCGAETLTQVTYSVCTADVY
jgi:hypothetical protein